MTREDEINKVENICRGLGYGNVMDIASRLWKQKLESEGLPGEAAHVPCIVTDKHVYTDDKVFYSIGEIKNAFCATCHGQCEDKTHCDTLQRFINEIEHNEHL